MNTDCNSLKNNAIGFYEACDIRNNAVYHVYQNMKNNPDGTAFLCPRRESEAGNLEHEPVTFLEFWETVGRTAEGLLALGLKPGDSVLIFIPMSMELYQAISAVMMIGAQAVFLDSWARRDQLGVCAEAVNAKVMISIKQAFDYTAGIDGIERIPIKIVAGRVLSGFSSSTSKLAETDKMAEIYPVKGYDTALITFTTGSSGRPRGANRTHNFLSAQHIALNRIIPYTPEDVDLPAFPIFSLNNLAGGVCTVIPAMDTGKPDDESALNLIYQIQQAGVTCTTLSPSMVEKIAHTCREQGIKLDGIRRAVTGGAPVTPETVMRFLRCIPNGELMILYGSTEVEPVSYIRGRDLLKETAENRNNEGVNVGKPVEGLDVEFIKVFRGPVELNEEGWVPWRVNEGTPGEIVVSGTHVCRSYFRNPVADRHTKIIDSEGKVWHRTGDVGYRDPDGNIWLVGRVHNAVNKDGRLIFPVKPEMIMKGHPAVVQSAYLGIPSEKDDSIRAVVVISDSMEKREEEFLIEIGDMLRAESIPFDRLEAIEEIPMDPRHHSKVDYEALRRKLS